MYPSYQEQVLGWRPGALGALPLAGRACFGVGDDVKAPALRRAWRRNHLEQLPSLDETSMGDR